MVSPFKTRPCGTDKKQQWRDCHMQESLSPHLVSSDDQHRQQNDDACGHEQSENRNLPMRSECARNDIDGQQQHRSKNEKAFVRRAENADSVRKELKWRTGHPLFVSVNSTSSWNPVQAPSDNIQHPNPRDDQRDGQSLLPSWTPIAAKLYIDQKGDCRSQDDPGGFRRDRKRTNHPK